MTEYGSLLQVVLQSPANEASTNVSMILKGSGQNRILWCLVLRVLLFQVVLSRYLIIHLTACSWLCLESLQNRVHWCTDLKWHVSLHFSPSMYFVNIVPEHAGVLALLSIIILGMDLMILSIRRGWDIIYESSLLWVMRIPNYSSIVSSSIILNHCSLCSASKMASASCFVRQMIIRFST